MTETQKPRRVSTDFSIARILSNDRPTSSTVNQEADQIRTPGPPSRLEDSQNLDQRSSSLTKALKTESTIGEDVARCSGTMEKHLPARCTFTGNADPNIARDLPWLRCTRYHPPRLPRKPSSGRNTKRRPGTHPRIPFTALQLQILEERYKDGAYLARRDVVHLSAILRLPQSRVKIWFQNRRARERRENHLQSGAVK
ncbi:homeobox protein MSX-1 [Orussus abietinus]|uniref:homeobox protein MSX-1 n=1 Tax=Orussus abietinus TaxID=222816 RepID=UPI0006269C78|nr:homeobox protein MSX-1 [Orussus abietinus]